MKSVYHPRYLSLNEAGQQVDQMTMDATKKIFDFWITEGYSPREISQVMQSAIQMHELHHVLERGVKEHKKDKSLSGGNR